MKFKQLLSGIFIFFILTNIYSQNRNFSFSANIKIDQKAKDIFNENGRFYLFLSQNSEVEPRTQTWPSPTNKTYIFAKNIDQFKSNKTLKIMYDDTWVGTADWNFDKIPEGTYYMQILWDQDIKESRINAPGNIFSEKQKITINQPINIEVTLNQIIGPRKVKFFQNGGINLCI